MAIRFVQTPSVLLVTAAREGGEMYARTLRAAGYHASKAASPPAAFRMATIYPPNVVVTDAPISGSIDAVELTRRLRADVRTSAVRIIVLTSKSRWNDADVALDAGADTLLEKPVPGHLLQSEIARLLAPRRQGAGRTSGSASRHRPQPDQRERMHRHAHDVSVVQCRRHISSALAHPHLRPRASNEWA
jgi:DNA-binding response OmpR family regulator